jgi:hypothetical protein
MTDMQVSIGASDIIGAIIAGAASYIVWSTKRLLKGHEDSIERTAEVLEEHEERLRKHERCLTRICTSHEHNHGQKVDCDI